MTELQTPEAPKTEKKDKAQQDQAPDHKVYTQSSQALSLDHARAMRPAIKGYKPAKDDMTDADLLDHAANVERFLGIHRQASPTSRETLLWEIRYKDLLNSKHYKAAAGQE